MACFPGERLGGLTRVAGGYGKDHARHSNVAGVQTLHHASPHPYRGYGSQKRGCECARSIGSGGEPDNVEDELPRLHAQVSFLELTAGNFGQTWNEQIKFDLCICSLGASEVVRFVI